MKFLDSIRYNCVPINRLEYTKENMDNKISYSFVFVFCLLLLVYFCLGGFWLKIYILTKFLIRYLLYHVMPFMDHARELFK